MIKIDLQTEEMIEEVFDRAGYCYEIEDLVVTHETIEEFKYANDNIYAERGVVTDRIEFEGFEVFESEKIQVSKGDRRGYLIVIDFGDFRVASYN